MRIHLSNRSFFAAALLLAALVPGVFGQSLTTLVAFNGRNGSAPAGPPIQGADGNFYGTTSGGGLPVNAAAGTVFMMTPSGQITTLYTFPPTGNMGTTPFASLIQGSDGNFYGTTSEGGASGGGTAFKITSAGTLTNLCTFGEYGQVDGVNPKSALLQGSDGNFYGATNSGGRSNKGTVFRVSQSGACSTLYEFGTTNTDGVYPNGLTKGSDGNFYGTTIAGGLYAEGTIFRITPGGGFATLYPFGAASTDGDEPVAAMTLGADGNLYGTTEGGGTGGCGTAFRITLSGALTTIHSFGDESGGGYVCSLTEPMQQGSDGYLYGVSEQGAAGGGTIFKMTLAGAVTTLYDFCSLQACNDGYAPSGIVQASDGSLYGATYNTEPNNAGTIFRFTLPSRTPTITSGGVVPVYSTASTIQAGEWISIYGTNLASSTATWNGNFPTSLGNTSVTVDGKPAYLWFVSPTQINLQVPDDPSTGTVPVVVTTPAGSVTTSVTLAQFAPSLSLLDSKHVAGIILRSNGTGAYGGGTYDILGPTGSSLGYSTVAARAGDTVALFAVGLGPTSPIVPSGQSYSGAAATTHSVSLTINGKALTPTFAGLTSAGLYQINLTVPAGLGSGDVPLLMSVGGAQTPAGVVISLQ